MFAWSRVAQAAVPAVCGALATWLALTVPGAVSAAPPARPHVTAPSVRSHVKHPAAGRSGTPVQIVAYQGHPRPSPSPEPSSSGPAPHRSEPPPVPVRSSPPPPPEPEPGPAPSPKPEPSPPVTVQVTTSPVCVTLAGIRACLPIGVAH